MQSISNGNLLEIIDLAHSLRQEHLFIVNEQNTFNNLTETLNRNSSNVAQVGSIADQPARYAGNNISFFFVASGFQLAWICSQQRQNLNTLIVARPDTAPSACCHKANILENTRFVEAHKAKGLKYQHVLAYNELFNFLHHSPYLLAQSLSIGDRLDRMSSDQMNSVVRTIATGLYGNVILSKDVDMVLRLLRDLIEIQIIVSDNPRRMLRTDSCSFTRLYSRLHESLFSAKLFLTAALHEPIMKVLIGDELMLDIDTTKAAMNYAPKERLKRFGHEGTDEYTEKFREFHRDTISALYTISKLFIHSLADSWALFPSTLRWVVQTMCHLLKSVHVSDKDLNAILTDMVFTHFICPAIVSPDLYGISDAPISENARFNLIQIGQILQMMAFTAHGDTEPKFSELFDMFDRNVVSELMEQLLETECDIRVSTIAIPHQNDFGRIHVLVTQNELNTFVDFFRGVLENDGLAISGDDRRKLGKILDQLPDKFEAMVNGVNGESTATIPAALESQSKTKQLLNLGKSTKNKLAKSMSANAAAASTSADHEESSGLTNGSGGGGAIGMNNNNYGDDCESVLMIPITINEENKFQLLTEQEVLNMNNISNEIEPVLSEQNVVELDKENDDAFDELSTEMPTRKHTRFSLSQDDQSIGNSDNLEVVSEAPSNHSVTSSLELEENDQNLNDNLSDMVSANVSGRGTPNISGRDTPSSQVTEGDNAQIPAPQMAKILSKARSDIDDKFCKFEIKKLVEVDETVSIISDTWSTDVLLASDSETLEPAENERNFSTPLIPSAVVLPGDNNFNPLANSVSQLRANYLDASDTRSESAWSTDVLASDSEKMTEVDTDDNQSIAAKSDITDAGRSEGDPIPDLIPHNQQAPDSPFFAPRNASAMVFRAPDSPMFTPRPPESPLFGGIRNGGINFDERRGIDRQSPRFPNDDYAHGNGRPKRYSDNVSSFRSYHRNEPDTFLTTSSTTMRRQNSAESSISNQSSQLDDAVSLNKAKKAAAGSKKTANYNALLFGDFARAVRSDEIIVKTSTDIINPFADDEPEPTPPPQLIDFPPNDVHRLANVENFASDEPVEHRRISNEQRNVSFDGRRNGMMAFTSTNSVPAAMTKRATSLNYENHEIIAKNAKTKSLQLISTRGELETSATDDDKNKQQDELLLVQKTLSLSLNDGNGPEVEPVVVDDALDLPVVDEASNKPPAKYTGAIPKSISFDASADKNNDRARKRDSQNGNVSNSPFRQNGSSGGFFNKIKQGFKNRRSNNNSNKSPRGPFDEYTAAMAMPTNEAGPSNPLFAQSTPPENGFNDTTEDILAKYRRKISSSSEATNSDSLGNNSNNRKSSSNSDDQRLSNILHDESIFLYSKAKQKLRLVLSTTDLHTADFRHTNVSPQSTPAVQ